MHGVDPDGPERTARCNGCSGFAQLRRAACVFFNIAFTRYLCPQRKHYGELYCASGVALKALGLLRCRRLSNCRTIRVVDSDEVGDGGDCGDCGDHSDYDPPGWRSVTI